MFANYLVRCKHETQQVFTAALTHLRKDSGGPRQTRTTTGRRPRGYSGQRGLQASRLQQHQAARDNPQGTKPGGAQARTLSLHTGWPFSGRTRLRSGRAAGRGTRGRAPQSPATRFCSASSPSASSSRLSVLTRQSPASAKLPWPYLVAHWSSSLSPGDSFKPPTRPCAQVSHEALGRTDPPLVAGWAMAREAPPRCRVLGNYVPPLIGSHSRKHLHAHREQCVVEKVWTEW